jgi:HEAT repeat protein
MTHIELSVAALLLGAYALYLTAILGAVLVQAARRRKQALTTQNQTPQIGDALVDYLAGSNDQARIRQYVRISRNDVADAILSFHGTVGGSARDRLCDLALELALVHDWCQEAHSKDKVQRRRAYARLAFVCAYEPCRRVAGDLLLQALEDADPEVRLAAARALVQSGTIEELGQVFRLAVSQSLLVRILLVEDLRRHASALCEKAVPEVLHSGNPQQVLAALQILVAWERALPLSGLQELLESPNQEIKIEAMRLAPLVPLSNENKAAILCELADGQSEASTAAAQAAGRLRLQEALPSLARCVRAGRAELARVAAAAMAEMPPRGWHTLQEIAVGPDTASAGIAAEALERARRKAGVE